MGLRTIVIPFRDAIQLVRVVDSFAAGPDGGLIKLQPETIFDGTIFKLAVQHRLPAIYSLRSDVAAGGLISYSPAQLDVYPPAASYVDRLLRGAKIGDLPVQFPTKYELVINLRTAKAMGLTLPQAFLLRADGLSQRRSLRLRQALGIRRRQGGRDKGLPGHRRPEGCFARDSAETAVCGTPVVIPIAVYSPFL